MVDGVGVPVPGAGYDTISLLSGLLGVNIGLVAKTKQESPLSQTFSASLQSIKSFIPTIV